MLQMQLRATDKYCIRAAQPTLPLYGSMLVYPLTCVELAYVYVEAQSQHSNLKAAQMLGWSSLWQKWLTVLPESSHINTIFEGAECQHSHLSSLIDDLTARTSQVLKCIKKKTAVHHDTLVVHIAKWTAACEHIINVKFVIVLNSANDYMTRKSVIKREWRVGDVCHHALSSTATSWSWDTVHAQLFLLVPKCLYQFHTVW